MTTEAIVRHSVRHEDGDAAYRVAAWQEIMGTSGKIVMTAAEAERFTSESAWRRMGPLMIGRVSAGDFRVVRTREAAKRIGLDLVFINCLVSGGINGVCGRRKMDFQIGSLGVMKLSSPSDFTVKDVVWTAIVAPRALLEATIGRIDALDGRLFAPGSPEALLVGAHIEALLALRDPLTRAEAALAGKSCLAMLAACFDKRPPVRAPNPATGEDATTAKEVRRFIDARLGDPELGWEAICQEFGLSRSALYRIMGERSDIARVIRQLRLARAYREVARRDGAPLTAIAARFGFAQERSFRRAFRQAFGYSPTEVRDAAHRDGAAALPESGAVIERWLNEL